MLALKIKLTQGQMAIVDAADYLKVADYTWCVSGFSPRYAARGTPCDASGRSTTVMMHRQIMDAQPGQWVKHINGDGLDNRRENLEIRTYGETPTKIELSQGKVAIVDACDFGRVAQYTWSARRSVNTWYAVRKTPSEKGCKRREVYMHREILDAREGEWVRHISENGLDNRKVNLKLRTHGETLGYAK